MVYGKFLSETQLNSSHISHSICHFMEKQYIFHAWIPTDTSTRVCNCWETTKPTQKFLQNDECTLPLRISNLFRPSDILQYIRRCKILIRILKRLEPDGLSIVFYQFEGGENGWDMTAWLGWSARHLCSTRFCSGSNSIHTVCAKGEGNYRGGKVPFIVKTMVKSVKEYSIPFGKSRDLYFNLTL